MARPRAAAAAAAAAAADHLCAPKCGRNFIPGIDFCGILLASAGLWCLGEGASSVHQRPAASGGVELDRVVLRSPVLTVCPNAPDALCGDLNIAGAVWQFQAQRSQTAPAATAGLQQHGDEFLEGSLIDDPGSTLHFTARPMAACGDGDAETSAQGCQGLGGGRPRWRAVRGVVMTSALELYEIRPASRTGRSVVSARSLHEAHGHEVLHYDAPPPSEGFPSTPSCLALAGEPDEGYTAGGDETIGNGTRTDTPGGRHARTHTADSVRNRQSAEHTVCTIFVDADAHYLEKWGGTGSLGSRIARTKRRMAETIFFADGLLAHPQNLAGVLRLRIAGMRVHSDRYMVPNSIDENDAVHPSVQVLAQYQLLLGTDSNTVKDGGVPSFREAGDPTSGQVCLNHLFTHQDFQSVLGVAYEASPNLHIHSGLCEATIVRGKAMNIGLTSTKTTDGYTVLPWKTLVSTAHELGHNFGAQHDCDLSDNEITDSDNSRSETCTSTLTDSAGRPCADPSNPDGYYLMYPSIGLVEGSSPNNALLSPCSKERVEQVLAAKGGCLSIPTNQCAAGDACCGGSTPVFGGAACLQDDGVLGGCGDNGVCNHLGCTAVNGSVIDCAVVHPTAAPGALASHIRRPIDTPTCEISQHSVGVCTQPCGVGSSAEMYTCGCSGSGPAACGGAEGYASAVTCDVAVCDPRAPYRIVIRVAREVSAFDDKEFQIILLDVLGWRVVVAQLLYEAGNFETLVEVSSCRMFANTTDCVPAVTIKSALENATTKLMIESRLGFGYVLEDGTRLIDGYDDPVVSSQLMVAICFFVFIAGLAAGVTFQCSKPPPPPPRRSVSRQSSRPPSQQSSRVGSRQPSGYIDDDTISPRSPQRGPRSGGHANGPPLIPTGHPLGLPTITAESVVTNDNPDNPMPPTDFGQAHADLSVSPAGGENKGDDAPLRDYTQFVADLTAGLASDLAESDVEAGMSEDAVWSEANTTAFAETEFRSEDRRSLAGSSVTSVGNHSYVSSVASGVAVDVMQSLMDAKAELHEAKKVFMDAAAKFTDSAGELRRERDALQAAHMATAPELNIKSGSSATPHMESQLL